MPSTVGRTTPICLVASHEIVQCLQMGRILGGCESKSRFRVSSLHGWNNLLCCHFGGSFSLWDMFDTSSKGQNLFCWVRKGGDQSKRGKEVTAFLSFASTKLLDMSIGKLV